MILNGYVYAGIPPLYKITAGKDKYIYLKDDAALEQYRDQNKGKKYVVSRMKGLGEMSAEETEETLVHPDTRNIKQITVEDINATNILFEQLMGAAVAPRKAFIQTHSAEATYVE